MNSSYFQDLTPNILPPSLPKLPGNRCEYYVQVSKERCNVDKVINPPPPPSTPFSSLVIHTGIMSMFLERRSLSAASVVGPLAASAIIFMKLIKEREREIATR